MACESKTPCDLGSRCTVFMNSRVKQSLREGAGIEDISAGLAYAVVRNCLNKVLKINNIKNMGENIIVQGGTFLNPSVHRAFEKLIGKKVHCPEISGLMGAFGCALHARDLFYRRNSAPPKTINLSNLGAKSRYDKSTIHCKGCVNQCRVSQLKFNASRVFYAGNRCENIFSNNETNERKGFNFAKFKRHLLFDRPFKSVAAPRLKIGIPRAMNLYENFPFWCTLFVELGMEVVLSSDSDSTLYEKGAGTVMSDSICFPAKLTHGHIIDLIEKKVDRIFYPIIIYEHDENLGSNSYNCPIISGYPEVIKSAVNPEEQYGIPFDIPTFSFKNERLFKKSCFEYLKPLQIHRKQFSRAFSMATQAHQKYKVALQRQADQILSDARNEDRQVLMMGIRPYHIDRFINHDIFEMLSQMGMDTVTADALPLGDTPKNTEVLSQWAYTNWLYNAANFTAARHNIEMVQLNSFGCGIDAIASDELSRVLNLSHKNLTLIRIDEVVSPGSIKLRFRTLIESMKTKKKNQITRQQNMTCLPLFENQDRNRQILVPYFSKFYSPFIQTISESTGYNFKVLPPPDNRSVHVGLKYTNNEICYPAIITVGDIIKALQSGRYDPSRVAAGITQTGAQCRASNYVSLIKKGLLAAGYHLPVITVHLKNTELNAQPGFRYSKMNLMKNGLYALAFADAISLMYHPLIVREKNKGQTWSLVERYIQQWLGLKKKNPEAVLVLIRKAVAEFNRIPIRTGSYPKIGIIGEIYANYNEFCNHDIVNWLNEQGIEVELPSLMNFFTQGFVNFRVDMQKRLIKKTPFWPVSVLFEKRVDMFIRKVNHVLSDFRFFNPIPHIKDLADNASKIIDLSIQFGEGWLIPGEIVKMAEAGVENILCLQPFGCIANQVVAKGIENRLKDKYPNLNLLFIDLDPNTSEANILNRVHFLVRNAKMVSSQRMAKDPFSA